MARRRSAWSSRFRQAARRDRPAVTDRTSLTARRLPVVRPATVLMARRHRDDAADPMCVEATVRPTVPRDAGRKGLAMTTDLRDVDLREGDLREGDLKDSTTTDLPALAGPVGLTPIAARADRATAAIGATWIGAWTT